MGGLTKSKCSYDICMCIQINNQEETIIKKILVLEAAGQIARQFSQRLLAETDIELVLYGAEYQYPSGCVKRRPG